MACFPPLLTSLSRRATALSLCALAFCVITACSSTPAAPDAAKKALSGTDEQIFLGDTIEKNYDPNVIMKRGEAFFEKEEYTEAITEYNHFLDLHRTHALAPYAAFRIGESQMKRGKGFDHEPEPVHKAIEAFEKLRKDFKGSKYDGQALEKIQECHDLLAQMSFFVGEFYYRRGAYLASVSRFEQIMKLYPDKAVAPGALYFLALNYHDLGSDDWARQHLALLEKKYPGSKYSPEGATLLAKINGQTSSTLLAKGAELLAKISGRKSTTLPAKQTEAASASNTQPTLPSNNPSGLASGLIPSVTTNSLRLSSATVLGQSFVMCRLGAWC